MHRACAHGLSRRTQGTDVLGISMKHCRYVLNTGTTALPRRPLSYGRVECTQPVQIHRRRWEASHMPPVIENAGHVLAAASAFRRCHRLYILTGFCSAPLIRFPPPATVSRRHASHAAVAISWSNHISRST